MKDKFTLIARILFALPFGIFGLSHLLHSHAMAEKLPAWLPGGVLWICFTGVCLIIACLAVVSKIKAKEAAIGVAAFLLVVILTLHIPALRSGNRQMAVMNLLKDISLFGGALTYAVIFSQEKRTHS